MRFALANLMNSVYGLGEEFDLVSMFELIPNDDGPTTQQGKGLSDYRFSGYDIPRPAMSHHSYEDRFSSLPVVFLVRNPADAVVSRFHHLSRHQGRFSGSLDDFVRDPDLGADHIVQYLASWQPHLQDPNVITVRYEDLKDSPLEPFSRLASQLGIAAEEAELQQALGQSTFEKMKALELQGGVGEPHQYDRGDRDSLRVRKGKVGGFKEEMSPETLGFLMQRFHESPGALELIEYFDIVPSDR